MYLGRIHAGKIPTFQTGGRYTKFGNSYIIHTFWESTFVHLH